MHISGAIMDETPRMRIPLCIYIKFVLWTVELGLVICGTYISFGMVRVEEECNEYVHWMVRMITIAGWMLFMLLVVGFIISFDPLGKQINRKEPGEMKELWEDRWETVL